MYNAILPVLVRTQNYDEAFEIYKEMISNIPVYSMNLTYDSSWAICGIIATRRNIKALHLFFKELIEANIEISDIHFINALRGFHFIRAMDEFFSLLRSLYYLSKQKGYNISIPNIHQSCMKDFLFKLDLGGAEEFLENIKLHHFINDDSHLKSVLALLHLRIGNKKTALQIFTNYLPKFSDKTSIYVIKEFFDHFEDIKYIRLLEKIYNTVVHNHPSLKEKDYFLFKILCLKGEIDEAIKLIPKLFAILPYIPATNVGNSMLEVYIKHNRMEEGEDFFLTLQDHNVSLNMKSYELFFTCIAETRPIKDFFHTLEEAKKIGLFKVTTSIHNSCIRAYIKNECFDDARNYFMEHYKNNELTPDADTIYHLLTILPKDTQQLMEYLDVLWISIYKNRLNLSIKSWIMFIDAQGLGKSNERLIFSVKKLKELVKKRYAEVSVKDFMEIKDVLIRVRLLSTDSNSYNYFSEFPKDRNDNDILTQEERNVLSSQISSLINQKEKF